jgi:S1-C subfamily serine protease
VVGTSPITGGQEFHNMGTGFMISPGVIVTASHIVHNSSDSNHPLHQTFRVIRAPDVGQQLESATLLVENPQRDIALLRVDHPRSTEYLNLESTRVPIGTFCGSLGFPFISVQTNAQNQPVFTAIERFQGSHISAFVGATLPEGISIYNYEVDSLMYPGSSGCPVFLTNSKVVGMQVQSLMENNPANPTAGTTRAAISVLIPSMDIISFARNNNIII